VEKAPKRERPFTQGRFLVAKLGPNALQTVWRPLRAASDAACAQQRARSIRAPIALVCGGRTAKRSSVANGNGERPQRRRLARGMRPTGRWAADTKYPNFLTFLQRQRPSSCSSAPTSLSQAVAPSVALARAASSSVELARKWTKLARGEPLLWFRGHAAAPAAACLWLAADELDGPSWPNSLDEEGRPEWAEWAERREGSRGEPRGWRKAE